MKDSFVRKFQPTQRQTSQHQQDYNTRLFSPLSNNPQALILSLYFPYSPIQDKSWRNDPAVTEAFFFNIFFYQFLWNKDTICITMDKNHYVFTLNLSVIIALGVISFVLCIASEFKRTKRRDLKLDGKLCYLPGSPAFGLGIAALICLLSAQVIGNFIICRNYCLREKRTSFRAKKPTVATTFLVLSWISFGFAIILLSAATSINRIQHFGDGWVDGECYIVKDGVYVGASILVLVTVGSTLASTIITIKKERVEQGLKVHVQVR